MPLSRILVNPIVVAPSGGIPNDAPITKINVLILSQSRTNKARTQNTKEKMRTTNLMTLTTCLHRWGRREKIFVQPTELQGLQNDLKVQLEKLRTKL